MQGLKLTTAPTEEPVTRNEAKLHLRLDTSPMTAHADDTLVDALIKTARRWCEGFQNRVYITQTWTLYLDSFPAGGYIELPKPPLQYVTEIVYKDGSGTEQTVSLADPSGGYQLETDDYLVDIAREPGRLYLKYGKSWPTTYGQVQDIQITFVAGYGAAAAVPDEIAQAILLKLSDLYENRGDVPAQNAFEQAAKSLLWTDRIVPV